MKDKLEIFFKDHNITNITCDSRNAKAGDAFFALKGKSFNGNMFINEALQNGAVIIAENTAEAVSINKLMLVPDVRYALAIAAGIVYPLLPQNIMAVTGTNGKTSVVSYIFQILGLLGHNASTFGTLGFKTSKKIPQISLNSLNTPDAITFRKILNELVLNDIDNVAFEASSHGIHQQRIGEVKVRTIGFPSFSQDHLDYHLTMEEYLQVKLNLLTKNLKAKGQLVINSEILESAYGKTVKNFLAINKINYCLVGKNAEINIIKFLSSINESEVNFEYKEKKYFFKTSIIGSFQAMNMLIAAKMVENIGINFDDIVSILPHVKPVAGRLERAGKLEDNFQIFVDYAHTPDALEKSLKELLKIKQSSGKLYLVFGCGGERDWHKRALMGKIATELADYVIVTDDNPRNEDPAKIRNDILKSVPFGFEIADREKAITDTIAKLQENDILLIAGKGHENYQIIGEKILPFNDIEIARKSLN